MKTSLFFWLMIFLSFSPAIFAQDDNDSVAPVCKQPFSSKFDEFEYTNLESAKEKLDLFGLQIKNQNARGIIIGYGGKITKSGEGSGIAYEFSQYLEEKFKLQRFATVSAWGSGHREKPFVELFIKPESCSSNPEATPTLRLDEVTFEEESEFFSKDISRKSLDEMDKLLVFKVDPPYPAAARAVRAGGKVLLLAIVDENGNVTSVKVIDGHPLLRAASVAAVRQWKYQIQKEKNKPVKFGGRIIIDFDKIAEDLPKVTLDY